MAALSGINVNLSTPACGSGGVCAPQTARRPRVLSFPRGREFYRRRPGGGAATARPEGLRQVWLRTLARPRTPVNRHFSYKSSIPAPGRNFALPLMDAGQRRHSRPKNRGDHPCLQLHPHLSRRDFNAIKAVKPGAGRSVHALGRQVSHISHFRPDLLTRPPAAPMLCRTRL